MEKLTGQQIIEKLKEAGFTVENFAHEEVPYEVDKYPEAVAVRKAREDFSKAHIIQESKWSMKWDSEENRIIYNNLPTPGTIAQELFLKELNLNWKEVEQHGGEGEGENWYSVKYFPDHDVYLKVSGYYYSYDGTHFGGWEDVREVSSQQKTITVYE